MQVSGYLDVCLAALVWCYRFIPNGLAITAAQGRLMVRSAAIIVASEDRLEFDAE